MTVPGPEAYQSPAFMRRLRLTEDASTLLWQLVAVAVLFIVFGTLGTNFWSRGNWLNTATFGSTILILALGETVVILTAGIDLSIAAVMGLSGVVAGLYLARWAPSSDHIQVAVTLAIGVATGSATGLLNGFMVTVLDITPFIATLGMLGAATGTVLVLTNGISVTVPDSLAPIGNAVWFGWMPVQVAVAVGCALSVFCLLRYTTFGMYTYAIGSDAEAARRMGIKTDRHLMKVYGLAGTLAGVAGVLTVAQFTVASPNFGGENALLNAIAACVIGGISLFGGRGRVSGTVIGTVVVASAVTGLVLMGVTPYWQTVFIGIVIVVSVYLQRLQQSQVWKLRSQIARLSSEFRPIKRVSS
jgi:ribose transport system permease protein